MFLNIFHYSLLRISFFFNELKLFQKQIII
jgi:hypothetical protein